MGGITLGTFCWGGKIWSVSMAKIRQGNCVYVCVCICVCVCLCVV